VIDNLEKTVAKITKLENEIERLKTLELRSGGALKVHRTGTYTYDSADTWVDMVFNLKIADETTDNFHYYDEGGGGEDTSIIVCDTPGLVWIGGCLHSYWNNAVGGNHDILSRILWSTNDGGAWSEARCLQMMDTNSRVNADHLTHVYTGTLRIGAGDWIKLQTRVSSTDLQLRGDATFDSPVAATLGILGMFG